MNWSRICFKWVVKTHALPTSMVDEIVDEYAQQGHQLLDFAKSYPQLVNDPDYVNPKVITEFGFDLGGPCRNDRPREVFDIDGLSFELPSEEVTTFASAWVQETIRTTRVSRIEYVKFKGTGCLIVPYKLATVFIQSLLARGPIADQRSQAFYEALAKQPERQVDPSRGVHPNLAAKLNGKLS